MLMHCLTRIFVTLEFLLHNTYFNTVIKLHIYKPGEVLGSWYSHYWGNLKRFLCHALTLPIQHTRIWISCQNHMRTCNSLLWSLSFLCLGVAHHLVRPRERESHHSHNCYPNHCLKNTMWNSIRIITIKINWIKSSQDTKFTKYLEMWPISIWIENILWHVRKCRIIKLDNVYCHNIG